MLKRFYLKYEKIIIPVGLFILLGGIFYYLDYYNYSLYNSGYKFYVLETFVDRLIPLVPEFFWIYILYYPLCFAPIAILKDMFTFRRVALAFALQFFISFIIFIAIPVRMIQPAIFEDTISARGLKAFYNFDPGFNVFPSLHVANLVMIVFIFYEHSKFWARILLFLTILISLSTMFVKQHYFVDVVSGAFFGWFVYYIVFQKDVINQILKECKSEAK